MAHSSLTFEQNAEPILVDSHRPAKRAPLGACDRLAQPAARECKCQLVVLGQLRGVGYQQLVG
jgi:hypothetical protein